MIKFIGKRSLANQHNNAAAATTHATQTAPANAKSLSFGATVEYADYPAKRWARLAISAEEQTIINQGTNEVKDWNKVKLWFKPIIY